MPVHIRKFSSEVTFSEGDLPLDEAQLDKLVEKVVERLESRQQDEKEMKEATALRTQASRPMTTDTGGG